MVKKIETTHTAKIMIKEVLISSCLFLSLIVYKRNMSIIKNVIINLISLKKFSLKFKP